MPKFCQQFAMLSAAIAFCGPVWAQTPVPAAVMVGGQTVSHQDFETALEAVAGRAVMTKIVYSALVRQAAAQAGLLPALSDVEARITELARRNPQVQTMANDPATGTAFHENLRTDIALENLRIQNVTASEAEIVAFYTKNKDVFTVPSQVQTTLVVAQTVTDAATAEKLLQQNAAPDAIAKTPGLRVAGVNGFTVNMSTLPPAVSEEVGKTIMVMKPGEIKTLPVDKYFLTFKVNSAQASVPLLLSQVHDEAARQVKLSKAITPDAELAKLYAANPPTFGNEKYKQYFTPASGK